MGLKEYRTVFVILGLVLVLIIAVAVISEFWPKYEERFFAMSILDGNKRAENYYPNGDPNIGVESSVRWYVYIYNHMGSAQSVSIRVKILNSTLQGPDTSKRMPSPFPAFFEFRRELDINETKLLPFFWYISEAVWHEDSVVLTKLVVNDATLGVNASALSGYFFRMVFELWIYDEASGTFGFTWRSREETYCVWNQMWFNATLPE